VDWSAFLRDAHYWLSRINLVIAFIMLLVSVYIGLLRHGDVTPYFRRATYAVVGLMFVEMVIGALMYFVIGMRPAEEVHLIYGAAAVLSLPFFIYVEVTAKKRPSMGSYIWGFSLLAAIIFRSIVTGAH
jgi:hypothetical protein